MSDNSEVHAAEFVSGLVEMVSRAVVPLEQANTAVLGNPRRLYREDGGYSEYFVEHIGVERTETLVDEKGSEVDTAGFGSNHISQAERQRQRNVESLATGERSRIARTAGVQIENRQAQA